MIFKNSKIDNIYSISGWGGTNKVFSKMIKPKNNEELENIIFEASPLSLIPRGLGRSYGDAAQINNGYVLNLSSYNYIHLDIKESKVTVGSGVVINQLLKEIIPKGFFIPVSPGTSNVTVGGAIASDVHGKNHHLNGSFGNHIIEMVIIDGKGQLKKLSSKDEVSLIEKNQFWATIGGMGLTGVIIEATFKLIPIKTSKIVSNVFKYDDLDNLMCAMVEADKKYQYSVSWVDSLHKNNRGILTCGDHALPEHCKELNSNKELLYYNPKSIISAPSFFPNGILNKFTIRAFNEAWFKKSPKLQTDLINDIGPFFHPLDGIKNWNKMYGSKGFIQYQFVVPDDSYHLIHKSLEVLKQIGTPSFLTVLKRFGPNNLSFLSFPIRGWTLAIDIPASIPNLKKTLSYLDEKVAEAGGRIYLAKDCRQSAEILKSTYKKLNEWIIIKEQMDPRNIFCSDLSKRLEII